MARRRGFTLVELLVVIAILALLAGIALPVIGGIRDRAANSADMSNLRQIGQAIAQFAADNNNRWPNSNIPIPGTTGAPPFMEQVDRYMQNDALFSPASRYNHLRRPVWYSKRFAKMPPGQNYDPKQRHYWGIAWGMNGFLWGTAARPDSFLGHILKAPNLSKLVLVGEQNTLGGNFFDPNKPPSFERDAKTSYRISRSGNSAFYLFGDYHIESLSGDQSIQTNPQYNSYEATNRLYYRWWKPGQTP